MDKGFLAIVAFITRMRKIMRFNVFIVYCNIDFLGRKSEQLWLFNFGQDTIKMSTNMLTNLIKMLTVVGLTILVFGYSYSQLALHIYGGTLLSTGVGGLVLLLKIVIKCFLCFMFFLSEVHVAIFSYIVYIWLNSLHVADYHEPIVFV